MAMHYCAISFNFPEFVCNLCTNLLNLTYQFQVLSKLNIFFIFYFKLYVKKKLISLKQTFKYEPQKKFSILVFILCKQMKNEIKKLRKLVSILEIQGNP